MADRSALAIASAKVAELKEILEIWQEQREAKKSKEVYVRRRSTVDRPVIHGMKHKEVHHVSKTVIFNSVVVAAIGLDVILVGVALDYSSGEGTEDLAFFAIDFLFAVIFLGEVLVRTHHHGWDFFLDLWNVFDYMLVVLSTTIVARPLLGGGFQATSLVGGIKGMRVFRLLRVVRYIRGIKFFTGLWMVLSGLLDSLKTVGWVGVLLGIITYVGAVAVRTLLGFNSRVQELWSDGHVYVGSVYKTMWSMWQIMTLDSWISEIGRPLYSVSPECFVVMMSVVLVGSFGTLNVIVAVMIENMRRVMADVENDTHSLLLDSEARMMESMAEDFMKCDINENGELEFDEFVTLVHSATFRYKLRLIGITSPEAESLFHVMDTDKSNSVSPPEFVAGLQKIRGEASGLDLTQIISFTNRQCDIAHKHVDKVKKLNERASELQARLDHIGRGITGELKSRSEAHTRYDDVLQQAVQREVVIRNVGQRTASFPAVSDNPKNRRRMNFDH